MASTFLINELSDLYLFWWVVIFMGITFLKNEIRDLYLW